MKNLTIIVTTAGRTYEFGGDDGSPVRSIVIRHDGRERTLTADELAALLVGGDDTPAA